MGLKPHSTVQEQFSLHCVGAVHVVGPVDNTQGRKLTDITRKSAFKGNGSALETPEINTKLNSAIYCIIYTNYAAIALTITKITTDKRQKIQIVGETGTFSGKDESPLAFPMRTICIISGPRSTNQFSFQVIQRVYQTVNHCI